MIKTVLVFISSTRYKLCNLEFLDTEQLVTGQWKVKGRFESYCILPQE